MLGSSITEPDWLAVIPNDRPTLVLAEGVLEYLTEADVKTLFNRLTAHFAYGQLLFDVMNGQAIRSVQAQFRDEGGAIHKWAVDDLKAVDMLDARLKRLTALSLFESTYMRQLPWVYRGIYGAVGWLPGYKTMMRLCRYAF
jgi:O-methyltransferase involved in polyketide biosynthesis